MNRLFALLPHTTAALALAAAGCTANPNDFGVDFDGDSDDVDTSVDTGSDTDDDTEGTDVDIDTDSGFTGGPGPECHPVDPLGTTGWTRTYAVTWEGEPGTEVQSPGGLQTFANQQAYVVSSTVTRASGEVIVDSYRTCSNGVAVWVGEETSGTAEQAIIPGLPPTQVPFETTNIASPGGQYLPDLATLSTGGSFTYEYDLMTKGGTTGGSFSIPNCTSPEAVDNDGDGNPDPDSNCVPVSGTVDIFPPSNVTVQGTTYSAYRIIDSRTELWSESGFDPTGGAGGSDPITQIFLELIAGMFGGFFGSTEDRLYVYDTWYVEGIGVVKQTVGELPVGGAGGAPDIFITRELQSYTNLP